MGLGSMMADWMCAGGTPSEVHVAHMTTMFYDDDMIMIYDLFCEFKVRCEALIGSGISLKAFTIQFSSARPKRKFTLNLPRNVLKVPGIPGYSLSLMARICS